MKQKKPTTESTRESRTETGESSLLGALDSELAQGSGLGNAAFQAQMDGVDGPETVALDVVRDLALPWLERGALALRVVPEEPQRVERRIALLEATALDHRAELVDQLRRGQASADAIHDAIVTHFGEDTPGRRSELIQLIDQAAEVLQSGSEQQGQWVSGTVTVDLSGATGDGPSQLAEAMLEDVGRQTADTLGLDMGTDAGAAVRSFCLAVFLAFHLDEEEEQDAPDAPDAEVG